MSTVSTARSCGFEAVCFRELLNPLFFIHVLEALSRQIRTGMPWVPLKGLKVYMMRTKPMVSEPGLDLLCNFGAFLCSVFRSGVGVSNIKCSNREHLVHTEMQRCQM